MDTVIYNSVSVDVSNLSHTHTHIHTYTHVPTILSLCLYRSLFKTWEKLPSPASSVTTAGVDAVILANWEPTITQLNYTRACILDCVLDPSLINGPNGVQISSNNSDCLL